MYVIDLRLQHEKLQPKIELTTAKLPYTMAPGVSFALRSQCTHAIFVEVRVHAHLCAFDLLHLFAGYLGTGHLAQRHS